jgi:decaprenylphospho-beta-D-ribofuranose 2-oxidase
VRYVETDCAGWGRVPVERCRLFRPEKEREVFEAIRCGGQKSYLSRGLGRSYGDAALNAGAGLISHLRLERLIDFDPESGLLECEAGASLAAIIETFLPRGFFPEVTPGTRHVTVGGAIASDVHGKNHHRDGTFASSLVSFTLLRPDGETIVCSREKHPEVFWATVGGMGLTGPILSARIRLRPVETAFVKADYRRLPHLDAVLGAFESSDRSYRYSVAWVDCLASGDSLGRAVLMQANDLGAGETKRGRASSDPLRTPARRSFTVPFRLPSGSLNRATVGIFNALYYGTRRDRRDEIVDYDRFFYPLDALEEWTRLYGRRGFIQYQVVVPTGSGPSGLRALLERLSSAGQPSFLGVLKKFGPSNEGVLSFPMEGYTLALDLPNRPGLTQLVSELNGITLRAGGRVYLAKDALLDRETFERMYPRAEEFRRIKSELDPQGLFSSSLARRVGLA